MKKELFKYMVLLIAFFSGILVASGQTTSSVQGSAVVYPSNPTLNDSVYVVYSYVSMDGCPDFYLAIDSVFNNKIYVVKNKIESDRACIEVITKFTTKINLGLLKRNTQIFFDGALLKTISMPCLMDKIGLVVAGTGLCQNRLFIEDISTPFMNMLPQLYAIESLTSTGNAATQLKLNVGDKVKFGGYKIKNDSTNVNSCRIVGIATCYEVTSTPPPPCVMNQKGEVIAIKDIYTIVKDLSTGVVYAITNQELAIGTKILFKGTIIQCITTPCYNIVDCFKVYETPPTPCVKDKKGVVVAGSGSCSGQLFIQEYSPISSVKQLYAIQNYLSNSDATVVSLKAGDEVVFGGYLIKNDSNTVNSCRIVGIATCYEVTSTPPPPCVMNQKGEVIAIKDIYTIVKDLSTGVVYAITNQKLAIGTKILFKGTIIQCITTPCYNIVDCFKVYETPPTPCVKDKKGVVVAGSGSCSGQLFIQEYSPISSVKQLYAIRNYLSNSDATVVSLKAGDEVVFGGYLIKNDSNTVNSCRIVGIATCYEVISTPPPPCVMNQKGEVIAIKDIYTIIKDLSTGVVYAITNQKLTIGTKILFKGTIIKCITTPCYNIVDCFKVYETPPTPCVKDKKGVVVAGSGNCSGQLFIQEYSPISSVKQLYAIQNYLSNSDAAVVSLKAGDEVVFGGYLIKNDSNTVNSCRIVGIATCYEVISTPPPPCVMNQKGEVIAIKEIYTIVKDLSTGVVYAITNQKLTIGTKILFKGTIIKCITTPCYNIVDCFKVYETPPTPCVMDKLGIVVPGIDGCTGRLFIKEITSTGNFKLYEIQNNIISNNGTTSTGLKIGDKVKFGGILIQNDSLKSILCYTAGVATCYEIINQTNTFTLAGYSYAGNDLLISGQAYLFKKGEVKAIASFSITNGMFIFTNLPQAAYTVYIIPNISIYKYYMPTFYPNKFLFSEAEYVLLNESVKDLVVKLNRFELPKGTGRIKGNIFFETYTLKDSVLTQNGLNKIINYEIADKTAVNIPVTLFTSSGEAVAWTLSDSVGNYIFEDLPYDKYKIVSETASAKAELDVNLTTDNSYINADLMLKSPEEKTAIDNLKDLEFNIYPNPVNDQLSIISNYNAEIRIYNATGQLLINQNLISGINTLNVTNLNKGIYLAKIGNSTIKIVKN